MSKPLNSIQSAINHKANNKDYAMSSIDKHNWAWRQNVASAANKLVLLALSDHARLDESGRLSCYPSAESIAAKTHLNHKTVRSALAQLASMGLIKDTGERKGSTKNVKVYELCTHVELLDENLPKIGQVESYPKTGKLPKNGIVSDGETYPKTDDESYPILGNESINLKSIKDITPLTPQGGNAALADSKFAIRDVEDTKPAKPKRTRKQPVAETIDESQWDINDLPEPQPLRKEWMQDPRMKAKFTSILGEYGISDDESIKRIWKLVAADFVSYWTNIKPTLAKAKKKCWVDTFANRVRQSAERDAWRWKKNGANDDAIVTRKPASAEFRVMIDEDEPDFLEKSKAAILRGMKARGEI